MGNPEPTIGVFDSSTAGPIGTPFVRTEEQEIGDAAMAALDRPEAMSPQGYFGTLEQQYNLPEGYLARTAEIESGGDPNAQNPNSSAGGMFQFIDSTAQQYGLTDKTDWRASSDAAARLAADNAAYLRKALGRKPTAAELYLAHQQGAGGAAKLLSNPNADAASLLGNEAVSLNAGGAGVTAGDFANQWINKFGGPSTETVGSVASNGNSAPATSGVNPAVVMQLAEIANSPYATPGQKAIVSQLINQQMQANDPLRQMQLEKAQLELDAMRNPQREPVKDANGRLRYPDTGEYVFPDVTQEQDAPKITKLTLQDGSEVAVQWNKETGAWDPIKAPEGGGVANPKNKLTESQSKLTLFQSHMDETSPALLEMEKVFDPSSLKEHAGDYFGTAGNYWKSAEGQQYKATAAAWAEGALRIATGAAATEPEIERVVSTYFAQPGDKPETIAFKQQLREMYARSIQRALGATGVEGQLDFISPEELTEKAEAELEKVKKVEAPSEARQWRGDVSADELRKMDRAEVEALLSAYDAESIPPEMIDVFLEILDDGNS
jgi:hypothetical protein